jgi:hypothetical protein
MIATKHGMIQELSRETTRLVSADTAKEHIEEMEEER